jgi:hypothetical protein
MKTLSAHLIEGVIDQVGTLGLCARVLTTSFSFEFSLRRAWFIRRPLPPCTPSLRSPGATALRFMPHDDPVA